jgi:hypothetical protein
MRSRRRTLLSALAAIGVGGGGVGYWQRRRLRRRDDVAAIESALEIDRPTPPEPISVRPEHAVGSYERAREHVSETERLGEDAGKSFESGSVDMLDRARNDLERRAPETLEGDAARLDALETYRLAISRSATVRGRLYGGARATPSPKLRQLIDAFGADLEAFDPEYRGESVTETIVQCAEADERFSDARSDLDTAIRMAGDERYSNDVAWERAAVGATRLYDAGQFLRKRGGPDRADALGSTLERLTAWIGDAIDGMDWRYEGEHPSYAVSRYRDVGLAEPVDPRQELGPGRLASAVRSRAREATVVATLGRFPDVPARHRWADLEYELGADAGTLPEAKATAVEAIEAAAATVGPDSLGRWLLSEILGAIASADRRLDRLAEEPNDGSERRWTSGRDRSILEYRAAMVEAEAVPDVLERVAES